MLIQQVASPGAGYKSYIESHAPNAYLTLHQALRFLAGATRSLPAASMLRFKVSDALAWTLLSLLEQYNQYQFRSLQIT